MMELAHIHNKHARPPRTMVPPLGGRNKSSGVSASYAILPDTYHYVSFVPINGHLFELDGLKEYPIDHGPWRESEKWTALFQRTITQRLLESQDCLFNLLALVPDPVPQISECLKKLQDEQTELLENVINLAEKLVAEREKSGYSKQAAVVENASTYHVISADKKKPITVVKPESTESTMATMKTDDSRDTCSKNSSPNSAPTSVQNTNSETERSTDLNKASIESSQPNKAATLLGDVSRALPANASELDAIAVRSIDDSSSLEETLRVAVAKVVKNYREADEFKSKLKEEIETKQRFRVEHSRRIHDYDAFIFDFVRCLAHNKQLPERLLKKPVVVPVPKGNASGRHKRKKGPGRPRTTLLVNGDVVN